MKFEPVFKNRKERKSNALLVSQQNNPIHLFSFLDRRVSLRNTYFFWYWYSVFNCIDSILLFTKCSYQFFHLL